MSWRRKCCWTFTKRSGLMDWYLGHLTPIPKLMSRLSRYVIRPSFTSWTEHSRILIVILNVLPVEKPVHLTYCLHTQEMLDLAIKYNKAVQEEDELPPEKLAIVNVGRQDAKKHLEEHVSNLMSSNIIQTLGTMLDTVVFWWQISFRGQHLVLIELLNAPMLFLQRKNSIDASV